MIDPEAGDRQGREHERAVRVPAETRTANGKVTLEEGKRREEAQSKRLGTVRMCRVNITCRADHMRSAASRAARLNSLSLTSTNPTATVRYGSNT